VGSAAEGGIPGFNKGCYAAGGIQILHLTIWIFSNSSSAIASDVIKTIVD